MGVHSKSNVLLSVSLVAYSLTILSCDKETTQPDQPPIITQYHPEQLQLTKSINNTIVFSITATDEDGDAVNYKFLKDNLEISSTNEYEWIVDSKGTIVVEGIAYNELADTVKWVISVENRAPIAKDTSFTMLEEATVTIPRNMLGYDPDNDELTFALLDNQNVNAVLDDNLIITGVLNYFGSASVTYELSDGAESDIGVITIEIENVNDLPMAITGDISVTIDTPVTLDGSQSTHPDAPLNEIVEYKWQQISGPDVLIINSDSSIANFTPVTAGEYEFLLTVRDNLNQEGQDTLTATIESYLLTVNATDVSNEEGINSLEVSFGGKRGFTDINGIAILEFPTHTVISDTLWLRDEDTPDVGEYYDKKIAFDFSGNKEISPRFFPYLIISDGRHILDYAAEVDHNYITKYGEYPEAYPIMVDVDSSSAVQYVGDRAEMYLENARLAMDAWNDVVGLNIFQYFDVDSINRDCIIDYSGYLGSHVEKDFEQDSNGNEYIVFATLYITDGIPADASGYALAIFKHELGHVQGMEGHDNNNWDYIMSGNPQPGETIHPDEAVYVKNRTIQWNGEYLPSNIKD